MSDGAAPPLRRTNRLVLRATRPSDVDPLFAIQGDPEVMRYTYCSPSSAATKDFLDAYARRFPEDGFGPWTAELAHDGKVVGWGGLNREPKAPHWGVEVAYFFDPAYWGRGLATELVEASLTHAFEDIGLPEVLAFARPENVASLRVLEKAGFVFLRFVPELERNQLRVDRERWLPRGRDRADRSLGLTPRRTSAHSRGWCARRS